MPVISFDDLIPQGGGTTAGKAISFDDLIPKRQPQHLSFEEGQRLLEEESKRAGIPGAIDAFGRGIVKTATAGFADELGAGARWLGGKVLPWRPEVTYQQALDEVRGSNQALAAEHPYADGAGQVTGAVGQAAALGRSGLSFAGRAIDAGKGLSGVVRGSAADGLVLGAATGAGEADGDASSRMRGAVEGGTGGLLIGGAIPLAMSGAGSAARKVISPFLTNAQREAAVQALAREGVDVTAGQRTGSNGLRYAESEIGGKRAADVMERQGEQYTAAALRRTGTNASRATPEVVDDAFRRIGGQFDSLASRNQILPDAKLAQDLGGVWQDYASLVPESQRAPVVLDMINDIGQQLGKGPLQGDAYQAARSRLDKMARSSARDPQLQDALYGLRNSLDDAMERSLAQVNPDDLGAWREVRNQYRNMLTIERAATGAGENAAQGLISPQALRNATVNTQGRRNYARGNGDFAELARSGAAVLQPMPNSGTAGRLNAQSLGTGLAGVLGGGAGYASGGDPASMAAGALAGFAAPRIAGRALMSGPVQSYLGNQAAQGMRLSPTAQKIFNMLMNIEGSQEAPSVGRAVLP
ncbi:hypothetical protein BTR14_03135 [Rhizobium rhizosphaerae]|uniref:Uncharacterized protein n=1 Tax=Xaviernesmea rhizosphaerae TaxID=1672749 RepID=A0ABX3PHK1_9HYPH|nr:hypothetical protein [Xaviernesmea rhizosphaerae]OQP87578.1 hypothetical protein BTR14_03135 [Xaviernesmea rhizosphaerae]